LRLIHTRYDARIDNSSTATDNANYYWTLANENTRRLVITVPLRPDAEMYDLANVLDTSVVPVGDNIRRLAGIREEWDGDANRYISTLTLRAY